MDQFEIAYEYMNSLSEKVSISTEKKLELYSLYKQATVGDCNVKKPSLFEFRDRAKWDAWNSRRGLSKEESKEQYVQCVESMNVGWTRQGEYEVDFSEQDGQDTQGMGNAVSAMAYDDEPEEAEREDGYFFAREGDVSKLSAYLQDSETSVNDRDEQGLTMLHYASDRGNMKVVELLVNRGADVNALTGDNETPLHYACLSERSDIAQYLIDHNCDLSIRDEEGNTAKENTSPAFWETLRV
ncbi:unnamed protein product [Umbelopsis vinacea]